MSNTIIQPDYVANLLASALRLAVHHPEEIKDAKAVVMAASHLAGCLMRDEQSAAIQAALTIETMIGWRKGN